MNIFKNDLSRIIPVFKNKNKRWRDSQKLRPWILSTTWIQNTSECSPRGLWILLDLSMEMFDLIGWEPLRVTLKPHKNFLGDPFKTDKIKKETLKPFLLIFYSLLPSRDSLMWWLLVRKHCSCTLLIPWSPGTETSLAVTAAVTMQ